ncbi:hypothetical protein R3W88_031138 [Solanum pinnatisectum]|uniref:Uncharacterized protein n=1 Tax=Solanum pinnatisectum TaxID=50273 RepID=A0AAV9LKI5_9SOLN|nr:hypothetical protein R3W88_031138 [Solanum pinnatisectum]
MNFEILRYIEIGKSEEVQLFYYFVKSESDPRKDPFLLGQSGGPGCSSFTGLAYEVGPLDFGQKAYNGSLPILVSSPYSWTKFASILFLEQPANTGFSYATTSEKCKCTDLQACDQVYEFLRKWLINHPKFILNPFYVSGDSYSGITVPLIVQLISDGIKAGKEPLINLKGYSLGNPVTFPKQDNYQISFCHGMGLISDELYESLNEFCKGDYININPTNKSNVAIRKLSTYWANDPRVQEALHVRKGTIRRPWARCRNSILSTSYTITVMNSIPYHVNLSSKGYQSLMYSYTRSFSNHMTYAIVKGGGHKAPQDKYKESFHMFKRWIAQQPLQSFYSLLPFLWDSKYES